MQFLTRPLHCTTVQFSNRDTTGNEDDQAKIFTHIHKDDILCIDLYSSTMAASASYDGQIVVWNVETGHLYYQFNVNTVKGNKKYQGTTASFSTFRICFTYVGSNEKHNPR